MSKSVNEGRVPHGDKHLQWIPVAQMRVSSRAQREQRQSHIDHIASNFDPDKFGTPTVNERDGIFWIIDGGHRVKALIQMGYEDQSVQCWTYHNLTEEQEAEKFLSLNDVKPVNGMDKFKVSVVAGRETETDIDRIVRAAGMTIGKGANGIGSVGALKKVYENAGPRGLAVTIQIIRDAYGMPGFAAKVIEGVGLFVANYETVFDQDRLVSKLAGKHGGVNGLLGRAEQIKSAHGVSAPQGVAAATVETYNQGRGGGKLPGWFSRLAAAS
ncbi:hypothetical protein SEA_SPIKELEE_54 [Mycobacterium phage Spikelee]|uniref:Uncharacterized protein n=1 Tax=Mycobacterium phage Spikelee TaxID=2301571 RepID=A0A385DRW0_9CAUD|nr:ParB-like partition protein [Mycobacterium phage Spikelee]AXQ62183.1 hypothetical protein SEA_SPIKELEE_54 [Mycobacterium phage Spikelee]